MPLIIILRLTSLPCPVQVAISHHSKCFQVLNKEKINYLLYTEGKNTPKINHASVSKEACTVYNNAAERILSSLSIYDLIKMSCTGFLAIFNIIHQL